jgi:nucleoid DNA-binding protein
MPRATKTSKASAASTASATPLEEEAVDLKNVEVKKEDVAVAGETATTTTTTDTKKADGAVAGETKKTQVDFPDVVKRVAASTKQETGVVREVIKATLNLIIELNTQDVKVAFQGFGAFTAQVYGPKNCVHPTKKTVMRIPKRKRAKFVAYKRYNQAVMASGGEAVDAGEGAAEGAEEEDEEDETAALGGEEVDVGAVETNAA